MPKTEVKRAAQTAGRSGKSIIRTVNVGGKAVATRGKAGLKRVAKPPTAGAGPTPGQTIIASLKGIVGAVKAGGVEKLDAELPTTPIAVPGMDRADVVGLRSGLGMNQAKFAAFLNVSIQTVQGWEQGRNPVQGIALRLLTWVREDPAYFKAKATG